MNQITVRHLKHQNSDFYSLTLTSTDRLISISAGKFGADVAFFELSPEEMLALGNAICEKSYKARAELERLKMEVK
ncbi:MAG: hypothetical protein R6U93_00890 [Dehalococcoidia bacterium]